MMHGRLRSRLALMLVWAAVLPQLGAADEAPQEAVQGTTPMSRGGFHLGVFSGGFDPASADRYEAWLGRRTDFNVEFMTETAFVDYTRPDGTKVTDSLSHGDWILGVWGKDHRPDRNMLFSVPLATKQDKSLANVAAGQYDQVYTALARSIARAYPQAIIRPGWEFNADWYSWNAKGRPNDYIAAFRHVAGIFKNASPAFTIDWCPVNGFSANMPADSAYPGDDVVDVIGMDVYNDYRWGNDKDDAEKRWIWLSGFDHGLQWQVRFAAAHHKPMSLPEWGVNRDDPGFIDHMHQWISQHAYVYAAYWDSNSAFQGMLSKDQYPHAAEAFRRDFDVPDSSL